VAIKTLAICDKCGRRETFEMGRTNEDICDTMVCYEGWATIGDSGVYNGKLLCMKCSEERDEETSNDS
jgi:hypothetical protein